SQQDIIALQDAVSKAAVCELVHDVPAKNNKGIPIINDLDIAEMNNLLYHVNHGTFGTGFQYLPLIFRGNFDGSADGLITASDCLLMEHSMGNVRDLAGNDGLITDLDLATLKSIKKLFDTNINPDWIEGNPGLDNIGDIDGFGGLTEADITILQNALDNQDRYDIDGDHLITDTDIALQDEIMRKGITADILTKADIHKDGHLDSQDWQTLADAITKAYGKDEEGVVVSTKVADINGDYKVNEVDVLTWVQVNQYLEMETRLAEKGIHPTSTLYDIANAQDQAFKDGTVDYHDRKMLAYALSKVKRDITGDNQLTEEDISKLATLINFMQSQGLTVQNIVDSDVNNDGSIDDKDETDITNALLYVRDVNNDGKKDAADVRKVQDVADYMRLQTLYDMDDINTADIDKDGVISPEEKALMMAYLNNNFDIVGSDGVITDRDINALDNILAYVRLNIRDEDIARADIVGYTDTNHNGTWDDEDPYEDINLNGQWDQGEPYTEKNGDTVWTPAEPLDFDNPDGNVDAADLKVMNELIQSFSKADINGDYTVDAGDAEMLQAAIDYVAAAGQGALSFSPDVIAKADLNGDGMVNGADLSLFEYYKKGMWDFNLIKGQPSSFTKEDLQIMETLVKYFEIGITATQLRRADIDGDGVITVDGEQSDIARLRNYMLDIKKGDMRGNGDLTQFRVRLPDGTDTVIDLKNANTTVTNKVVTVGAYTTNAKIFTIRQGNQAFEVAYATGAIGDDTNLGKQLLYIDIIPEQILLSITASTKTGPDTWFVQGPDGDYTTTLSATTGVYPSVTFTDKDGETYTAIRDGPILANQNSTNTMHARLENGETITLVYKITDALHMEVISLSKQPVSDRITTYGFNKGVFQTLTGGDTIYDVYSQTSIIPDSSNTESHADGANTVWTITSGSATYIMTLDSAGNILSCQTKNSQGIVTTAIDINSLNCRNIVEGGQVVYELNDRIFGRKVYVTVDSATKAVTKLDVLSATKTSYIVARKGDNVIDSYDMQRLQEIVKYSNYSFEYANVTAVYTNNTVVDGHTWTISYLPKRDKTIVTFDQDGRYIESVSTVVGNMTTTVTGSALVFDDIKDTVTINNVGGKKLVISLANIGVGTTKITQVAEIKVLGQDLVHTVKGFKRDADGQIVLDANGQPVPEEFTQTERVTNSLLPRADINGDGFVTYEDKIELKRILNKALDVNGDGDIDSTDLARITDVLNSINMNLTEDDIRKLDVSGPLGASDGLITGDDITCLSNCYGIFTQADFNGDGKATQEDVDYMRHIFDFVAKNPVLSKETVEKADLDGNGVVDSHDMDLLEEVINNLRDVDGNGIINTSDATRLLEIARALELGVDEADITKADIDGDGDIDATDIGILEQVYALFNDADNPLNVNGDTEVSHEDLIAMLEIYKKIQNRTVLSIEEMSAYDLSQDGVVSQADVDEMRRVLMGHVDVNGDGVIDWRDQEFIDKVIEYQGYNIKPWQKELADIDGDKEITSYDIYRINQLISVYQHGNVDGDINSLINQYDIYELEKTLNFLKDVQTVIPETVKMADLNHDGIVDEADRNKLAEIISHAVDMNGDKIIDNDDVALLYKVIDALKYGMDRQEMWIADEPYEDLDHDGHYDVAEALTYDYNNDGDYDQADGDTFTDSDGDGRWSKVAEPFTDIDGNKTWTSRHLTSNIAEGIPMLQEAIATFSQLDINGDGQVNAYDIQLLIDVMTLSFAKGAVYDYEIKKADVNGDGILDYENDYHMIDQARGSRTLVIKGSETMVGPEGRVGFFGAGTSVYSRENNTYVSYRFSTGGDVPNAVYHYKVGLDARSFNNQALPIEGYSYHFEVYMDNGFAGEIVIPADRAQYIEGALDLDIARGVHEIKFVWVNAPTSGASVQIDKVFMRNTCDIDADQNGDFGGVVDQEDINKFLDVQNRLGMLDMVGGYSTSLASYLPVDPTKPREIDVNDKNYVKERFEAMVSLFDTPKGLQANGKVERSEVEHAMTLQELEQAAAGLSGLNVDQLMLLDTNKNGLLELNEFLSAGDNTEALFDSYKAAADDMIDGMSYLELFDKINMTTRLDQYLKGTSATDDQTLSKVDVDTMDTMVLSIYQTSRLQGADIAGKVGGTLQYKPDGIVDAADIEAAMNLLQSFVDVTGDGVVNDNDTIMIQDIVDFNRLAVTPDERNRADVNGDGLVNAKDHDLLQKYLRLYGAYDVDGNGATDLEDRQLIVDLYNMFKINIAKLGQADIAGNEEAVSENGVTTASSRPDGKIDQNDQQALLNAVKYSQDINGDSFINSTDVDILNGIVLANLGHDPALVAKFDRTGYDDVAHQFTYKPDGVLDEYDVALLRESIKNRIDINGDSKVDILDVAIAGVQVSIDDYAKADFSTRFAIADDEPGSVDYRDLDLLNETIAAFDIDGNNRVDEADLSLIDVVRSNIVKNSNGTYDIVFPPSGIFTSEARVTVSSLPLLSVERTASGAPYLAYRSTLKDDFTGNTSRLWEPVKGDWAIENNAYAQNNPSGISYLNVAGNQSWGDVDVNTMINFSSFYKKAGIIVRADRYFTNYYRAELSNNAIKLQKFMNGIMVHEDTMTLGMDIDRMTELGKDVWYNLEVNAHDNTIDVYLNGVLKKSFVDSDDPIKEGTVSLFTDGCQAAFDDTAVTGMTPLTYVAERELLDFNPNGDTNDDGSAKIDAADYAIVDQILKLTERDTNDDDVPATEDDFARVAQVTRVLALGDRMAADKVAEVMAIYDVNEDGRIDLYEQTLVSDMANFSDTIQRQVYGYITTFDFDGTPGITKADRDWVLQTYDKYKRLDQNGDDVVNESDFQRLKSLAQAQLLLMQVGRNPDGTRNEAWEHELLKRSDVNKNGRIDQDDIETLGLVISIYGKSDVTGDGFVNGSDVARIQNIIALLYEVGKIVPSEIIRMDLVGPYNPLTKTYAARDGKIDDNDLKKALELLSSVTTETNYAKAWQDIDGLFRVGIERIPFETADLDADGKINQDDIQMFLNKVGRYLRTDINGDGYVDRNDLDTIIEVIKAIYKQLNCGAGLLAAADLNGDTKVDDKDVAIANMLKNIDSDPSLNRNDIRAVEDLAYFRQLAALAGSYTTVDMLDVALIGAYSTQGVVSITKDGYDVYNAEGNNHTVGLTLISALEDASFTYNVNVTKAGRYSVGLMVRNYNTTGEVDAAVDSLPYTFKVFVDGVERGVYTTASNKAFYMENGIEIEFDAADVGAHFIKFVPIYGALEADRSIQIGSMFADSVADINHDGTVDIHDVEIAAYYINTDTGEATLRALSRAANAGDYPNADLNGDGVIDYQDVDLVKYVFGKMRSGEDYENEVISKEQVLNLATDYDPFSESVGPADINGDGSIDDQDMALVQAGLFELYYQQNVSNEERALVDINGDGVIDFSDMQLLVEANAFYAQSDVNGDGLVDRADVEALRGLFDALYSEEILSFGTNFIGGTITYADLTTNGTDWVKNGIIDPNDVAILSNALTYRVDVNNDGVFDENDRAWIQRVLIFKFALKYKDMTDAQLRGIDFDGDGVMGMNAGDAEDQVWYERLIGLRGSDPDILPGISGDWTTIINTLKALKPISIDSEGVPVEVVDEDFSAGVPHATWTTQGAWSMVSGLFQQTSATDEIHDALLNTPFEDGVVNFTLTLSDQSIGKKAGIVLRSQSNGDCYYVSIEKTADNEATVRLEKRTNEGDTYTIEVLASNTVFLPDNNTVSCEVRMVGGTTSVHINNGEQDRFMFNYVDLNPLPSIGTKIGLFTANETVAYFDEYRVKEFTYKPGLAITSQATGVWTTGPGNGTWQLNSAGELIQKSKTGQRAYRVLDNSGLKDIVIDADIKFDGADLTNTAGIIFKSDAAKGADNNYTMNNYYEVRLDPGDGRVKLYKVTTVGNQKHEIEMGYDEIPIQREMYYRLNVKVIGDHIEVRVNGKLAITVQDTNYHATDCGSVVIYTGANTKAAFKNIDVRTVKPFDQITAAEAAALGVDYNLIDKLDTLSKTRNFANPVYASDNDVVRVNGDDRLMFEILGNMREDNESLVRADVTGDGIIDEQDYAKIALAENFCVRNPVTNVYAGDVNRDGTVDTRDVELIAELAAMTSDANAKENVFKIFNVSTYTTGHVADAGAVIKSLAGETLGALINDANIAAITGGEEARLALSDKVDQLIARLDEIKAAIDEASVGTNISRDQLIAAITQAVPLLLRPLLNEIIATTQLTGVYTSSDAQTLLITRADEIIKSRDIVGAINETAITTGMDTKAQFLTALPVTANNDLAAFINSSRVQAALNSSFIVTAEDAKQVLACIAALQFSYLDMSNILGTMNTDGMNKGDVLAITEILHRLHLQTKKSSTYDFIVKLADNKFTFKDIEYLIRLADVTGDGVVNFRDRDRLVQSDILYTFLVVNKQGMEDLRQNSKEYGSLGDFSQWDDVDKASFIADIKAYVTGTGSKGPVLRDFDGLGTFTTTALAGTNTDVVNNITTVTHTDGSQSQIYFNPNPAKTDIWEAWYVEPNKRPKVTHKVTFTGQPKLNADG
ncbi:MAG: dockerin type I domain-containing protein, partial [Candidatus Omnitrophica bacterium]|nr:dockerin type I domain-containing protein [Candidatus Omnitrophota bacterium]